MLRHWFRGVEYLRGRVAEFIMTSETFAPFTRIPFFAPVSEPDAVTVEIVTKTEQHLALIPHRMAVVARMHQALRKAQRRDGYTETNLQIPSVEVPTEMPTLKMIARVLRFAGRFENTSSSLETRRGLLQLVLVERRMRILETAFARIITKSTPMLEIVAKVLVWVMSLENTRASPKSRQLLLEPAPQQCLEQHVPRTHTKYALALVLALVALLSCSSVRGELGKRGDRWWRVWQDGAQPIAFSELRERRECGLGMVCAKPLHAVPRGTRFEPADLPAGLQLDADTGLLSGPASVDARASIAVLAVSPGAWFFAPPFEQRVEVRQHASRGSMGAAEAVADAVAHAVAHAVADAVASGVSMTLGAVLMLLLE